MTPMVLVSKVDHEPYVPLALIEFPLALEEI